MALPDPVQLYELKELENIVQKIFEILGKIETELKIDPFHNLTSYLE